MEIISAIYARPDNLQILAILNTGEDWLITQPCDTFHRFPLQRFLDDGGEIMPYVPPTEPAPIEPLEPLEEQVAKLRSRLDALDGGRVVARR